MLLTALFSTATGSDRRSCCRLMSPPKDLLCFSEMCALLQKSGNSALRLAKLMGAWQHLVSDVGMLEGMGTLSF